MHKVYSILKYRGTIDGVRIYSERGISDQAAIIFNKHHRTHKRGRVSAWPFDMMDIGEKVTLPMADYNRVQNVLSYRRKHKGQSWTCTISGDTFQARRAW